MFASHHDLTMTIIEKFFSLLRIAVGNGPESRLEITEGEWPEFYVIACKQSLVGIFIDALDKLNQMGQKPRLNILYEWIGQSEQIRQQNQRVDQQCEQLSSWFEKRGFPNCIIKGQGVARLYPNPNLRQPGDIDIWVDGNRDDVVSLMRSQGIDVSVVDYVNCHAAFFGDTEVEVHFRPTWFYNPFVNKKVQEWIRDSKTEQIAHYDEQVGFGYPTVEFNLVFSLIHIYRHVLFEGIGLRQLTDYYFILQHSNNNERQRALAILNSFGVKKFVGAVMYVMQRVYHMDSDTLICIADDTQGELLLSEILLGGNFGKYDKRIKRVSSQQRWKNGFVNMKRNLRFMRYYPSEVLWMPIWKVWHYFWRMKHGYLD